MDSLKKWKVAEGNRVSGNKLTNVKGVNALNDVQLKGLEDRYAELTITCG